MEALAQSLKAQVEALIFASPRPIKLLELLEILDDPAITSRLLQECLDELQAEFGSRSGGFCLEHLRGIGYQFRTLPELSPLMERLFASRPRPLSRASQETLAIIAYRQPVSRADIEFIRGVDAGSILKNLLERDLVRCVGRRADAGRPMLFGTTEEFLRAYGLTGLHELPPLEAFQPAVDVVSHALNKIGAKAIGSEEIERMIQPPPSDPSGDLL